MNRLLIFILAGFFVTSCIPPSKTTYVQETIPGIEVDGVRMIEEQQYIYRLKPGDIISIKIASVSPQEQNFFTSESLGSEPLISGLLIDDDGNIELTYVGSVEVASLTLPEVQEKIRGLAAGYLDSPTVLVRLLSFHFTILGEVNNQNKYTTYNPQTTILEAIGLAGGLTEFAERTKIKIIRSENNITKIAYVDVLDEKLIQSPYYYIQPNDVIAVSSLPIKNYRQNQVANISLGLSGLSVLFLIYFNFIR